MNTEQLRNMIENQKLEPYLSVEDRDFVQVAASMVFNTIARTLRVEYNNACCAEDGRDYYFKACDYVNKQYRALLAMSNRCWGCYLANVETEVEFRTRRYIAENHEYLEAKEEHRIKHMEDINKKFYDFVFTFVTLRHFTLKACENMRNRRI